jgi:hypothetical protein
MIEGMPGGRPTCKSQFPENWKQILIDLGKEGKSQVHMAKALGMSKRTLFEMKAKDEEFSRALDDALDEAQVWFENVGREGMFMGGKDNPFQANLWALHMKNRFGWADKQEVSQTNQVNVTISKEDADSMI